MKIVLFRFAIVWVILHVLLFFVERWRYKKSSFNLEWFLKNGMCNLTYLIIFIDIISIVFFIGINLIRWIFQPII